MLFYIALAIAAGLCSAFQSPTNATLSRYTGNLQATCISFGGGALCLAVLTLTIGTGDIMKITETSWWQLLGGVYGVGIVLTITYAIPRLGAALASTILMLGQISMGTVIDTLGLMQMDRVPLAPGRVIGCFLVLVGIIMVYQGKRQQEKEKEYGIQTIVVVICIFLAGVGGAMQSPTNNALAMHVGKLESSFINFATGFLFILLITLMATKGRLLAERQKGIEWWMTIGGPYGATVVFINVVAVPHLGTAILLICTMLGQLGGGMLVDTFGLLRTAKIKMNSWRYAGILVIALGVVAVAITKA